MKAGSLFMGWIMLSASKSSKNLLTISIVNGIGGKNIGFAYQNYIIRMSLTYPEAVVCDRFITKNSFKVK